MDICDERKDMEKDIDAIISRATKLVENGDLKELVYLQLSLQQTANAVERMAMKLVIGS